MKKLLATLLFMPVIAFSQSNEAEEINIPTYCVSIKILEEVLTEFNELPMLRGKTERHVNGVSTENTLVIFMNPETKTWTIVEKMANGSYCVLSAGASFEPVPKEIIDSVINSRQQKTS
jgi:hypothetical protein